MTKLDNAIQARIEKFSHAFQRWTGKISFWQAKILIGFWGDWSPDRFRQLLGQNY